MVFFNANKKFLLFVFLTFLTFNYRGQTSPINRIENWLLDHETSRIDVILDTLNNTLRTAQKKNDLKTQVHIYQRIAVAYANRLKDLNKALAIAKKIKNISKNPKNSIYMVDFYNTMSNIFYLDRIHQSKAWQYADSAIEYAQKHFPDETFPYVYSNSALRYLNKNDYEKALAIFYSLLNWKNKNHLLQQVYTNIGIAHMYSQKHDSVEFYFLKSLDLAKKTHSKSDDFIRVLNLGIFYQETGNNEKALNYLKEAESKIAVSVLFHHKRILQQSFAELYESSGDYPKAIKYRKLEMQYVDSIQSFNLSEQVSAFEHKERIKALESNYRILELEKTGLYRKYIFILIFLLAVGIFTYFHLRNGKIKAQLQIEKEHLERANMVYEKDAAERETATKSMILLEKENLILSILTRLKKEKEKFSDVDWQILNEIITDLDRSLNNKRWIDFETRFSKVHPQFLENLKIDFPNLTQNEKNLCCFLLLNMSSKEICAITYQSLESVNMARIRLRKKLNLTNTKQDLAAFLANYSNRKK
jgi:tetratricopeptide (TPR) repeat protein